MRTILFRGKRVGSEANNGEWVEGSLIKHLNGRSYIFPIAASITKCCALYEKVINPTYEVIPSSVGQYTGLEDKSGKKIFEGDIDKTSKYVVSYCDGNNESLGMSVGWYLQRNDFESWVELTYCECLEIIGNVTDNPELLNTNS